MKRLSLAILVLTVTVIVSGCISKARTVDASKLRKSAGVVDAWLADSIRNDPIPDEMKVARAINWLSHRSVIVGADEESKEILPPTQDEAAAWLGTGGGQ